MAQPRRNVTIIFVHVLARLGAWALYVALSYPWKPLAWGDIGLYQEWAGLIGGTWAAPPGVTWMYPPGAAAVLAAVDAVPLSYDHAFVVSLVVVDAAVLALLLRRGAHPAGAWTWALLVPALGLTPWARLDMLAVAPAAAALLLAATRPRLAGALAAVGTAVKAWPVLLGLLFLRTRSWLLGALITGLAVAAAATLLLDGAWDFTTHLAGRGIQVESVLATPWLVRQALGVDLEGETANGTYEVFEPGVSALAAVSTGLIVVGVAVALRVSSGHPPAVRWWAAVMALLATSPLLSAQFVLWIVGAVAVAASLPGEDGRLARRGLPAIALLVVLTHLVFPTQWWRLIDGGDVAALTLAARNVLLVAVTAWLLVSLARSPRPAGAPTGEPTPPTTTAAQSGDPDRLPVSVPPGRPAAR